MSNRFRLSRHCVAAVLLLTATLAASKLSSLRPSGSLVQPLDTIERNIGGFTATDNPALSDRVLGRLLPTAYVSRTYHKPGMDLDLFIAFYAQQRAGESMQSPKHCLPGAGWEIWDYGNIPIPVGDRNLIVNSYHISRDSSRMLVLYWYQSKGRIIASEYMGKILLARDALLQNSTAGSIVRVIVPDRPGALDTAVAFASALIPQVGRCFGG
jgi:EpsI family protein